MGQTYVNRERLYDDRVKSLYARGQYAIVPQAVPRGVCAAVLRSINGTKFILNDEPEQREVTRFYTKNGASLIAACPALVQIERDLLDWVNAMAGVDYVQLDNRPIGLALNVTPGGGGFGSHSDRHEITVVLFLNDLDSGDLVIHPDFPTLRKWISWIPGLPGNLASRLFNRLWRKWSRVRIRPRAGTVVAFVKLLHSVSPVKSGDLRASFVLGFDRPGVSFMEGQQYYGFGTEDFTLDGLARLADD